MWAPLGVVLEWELKKENLNTLGNLKVMQGMGQNGLKMQGPTGQITPVGVDVCQGKGPLWEYVPLGGMVPIWAWKWLA